MQALLPVERALAPSNVWKKLHIDLATLHLETSWSKAGVLRNMFAMLVTLAVFHFAMLALNLAAWKVLTMVMTRAVFHEPMFWLNTQLENAQSIFVTLATFHLPMF
jgi:hypothetical protein